MKISTGLTASSLVALSALYSATSVAELADEQGFSGDIVLFAGYSESTSNFDTGGKKVKTGDLNQKGDSEGSVIGGPLGSLRYTFGQDLDKQVFIGTSDDDLAVGDVIFEIGYSQEFNSGMVMSLSLMPGITKGEVWADPYLLDSEKTVIDTSGHAGRFQVDSIAGSNFSMQVAYGTLKVDDDKSGSAYSLADQKLLDRNGSTLYLQTEYQLSINETNYLIPSITYMSKSADGDAMSYDSYGADLTYFTLLDGQSIALTASYSHKAYDAVNPLFNEKQKDDAFSLFAMYESEIGFGLDNWTFVSILGYDQGTSNIEFYETDGYLAGVGIKYNF